MTEPKFVKNAICHSDLTGRWYFVRKAEVLGEGNFRAYGNKIDITDQITALIDTEQKAQGDKNRRLADQLDFLKGGPWKPNNGLSYEKYANLQIIIDRLRMDLAQ